MSLTSPPAGLQLRRRPGRARPTCPGRGPARPRARLIAARLDGAPGVQLAVEAPGRTAHRPDAGLLAELLRELEIQHVVVEVGLGAAERVVRPAAGVEPRKVVLQRV